MAIIFGDRNDNTIAAAAAGTTIFGMSGADTLSSAFATADLRGGWGGDVLIATYSNYTFGPDDPAVIRWSVSGDQGADNISLSSQLQTDSEEYPNNVDVEYIVDGGDGDDTISISNSIDEGVVYSLLSVAMRAAIVDLSGNNTINYNSYVWTDDSGSPRDTVIDILLGDGNDHVSIADSFSDWNVSGYADYNIDLGSGANALQVDLNVGYFDVIIAGGTGGDNIDFSFYGYEANDNGLWYDLQVSSGDGNDVAAIELTGGSRYGGSGGTAIIDLGDGQDRLNLSCDLGGIISVIAGQGDDDIFINYSNGNDWFSESGINVALGEGNNKLVASITGYFYYPFSATISSGVGNDILSLNGGTGASISSGAGADTITAGSGADTISGGTGGDSINIAKSIFDTSEFADAQTLTLTDFSLADLDKLTLTGFTLTGTIADGILNTAVDFVALKTPGGDVQSFVQTGADALLTLNLGAGETGQILFQNFTIPVLDAPRSFTGTSANNVFVGGNNADQFFLKLGQDRATGNAGADLFRVNAVTSHNNNGDRHTITDLNFAEGDVLRFDNFGPGWANNAVNPANDLQYVAGSFNNWIVNSVADLRELRDSGAVTVSAITGGSSILFEDQAGDDVRIDLLGVYI